MKSAINPEYKGEEFIPTLGNMIREIDGIIKNVPPYLRSSYAKLFVDTEIERLLLSTARFEEEDCTYCREARWKEPSVKNEKLIWFILDEIATKHSATHCGSRGSSCSICDRAVEAMRLIENKPTPEECKELYRFRQS